MTGSKKMSSHIPTLEILLPFYTLKLQSGDKVLADHLASCGKTSLYTSKTTQNELIGICGSIT